MTEILPIPLKTTVAIFMMPGLRCVFAGRVGPADVALSGAV
jgi:hypothetical protein